MKLPTKLVAVKKISSSVARSSFTADDIEKAAKLIIEAEGTINPVVLRRTSLESYEVVDGHFEYYAAVRARELSPLKGEMIQAIILESGNEDALLEQVKLLRKGAHTANGVTTNGNTADPKERNLESIVANLEKIFTSQFELLRQDNRALKQRMNEIESKVQTANFGDELVQRIVSAVVNEVSQLAIRSRSRNKSIDELRKNPLNLNSASKSELCSVPGIGPKRASEIIEMRRTKGSFNDIDELAEIKGVSVNTISSNRWRECFVI
jgi:ParB family chromosome partitioning protein